MLHKKQLIAGFMTTVISIGMFSTSAFAANNKDSALPTDIVGYSYHTAAFTELREKTNTSSHYVYNTAGFDFWINSLTPDETNLTVNRYAIVPSGTKRRVRNYIYEEGYRFCKLSINSSRSSVTGMVQGFWSPDCVGDYPAAN